MECGGLVSWSIQEFSWLMRGVLSRDVSWAHLVSLPHLTFFLCRSGIQLWDTTATTATSPVHKKLEANKLSPHRHISVLLFPQRVVQGWDVSAFLPALFPVMTLSIAALTFTLQHPLWELLIFSMHFSVEAQSFLAAYDCLLVWSQSSFGCFPTLKVILSPVFGLCTHLCWKFKDFSRGSAAIHLLHLE